MDSCLKKFNTFFIQTETKVFEVAEYMLPLLDGKLTVPDLNPLTNGKIPITVDISYTSGGEASGKATVSISYEGNIVLTKTITVNSGTATFDVDMKKDLKVDPSEYSYYEASLIFEDPLTGTKVTDTKSFGIRPYSYRFEAREGGPLNPGSDLKFTVTMVHVDGSPAPAGTKIYLKPNNPNTLAPQNLTIGEDGSVSSSYFIPEGTTYVSMDIIADNAMEGYFGARLPIYDTESTGPYCQIEVMNET